MNPKKAHEKHEKQMCGIDDKGWVDLKLTEYHGESKDGELHVSKSLIVIFCGRRLFLFALQADCVPREQDAAFSSVATSTKNDKEWQDTKHSLAFDMDVPTL